MSTETAQPPHGIKRFWKSYFGVGVPAKVENVHGLWTGTIDAQSYADPGKDKYQAAILEQYKIYVEMADRVSARRGLTNTFFLTLNTAVLALIGASWQGLVKAPFWILIAPLVGVLAACLSWFWLVRSYRQLNNGRYAVIGALEERLPASPYYRAEWTVLGQGADKARYWPFTHVEQCIPFILALAYVGGFAAIVWT